MKKVISIMLALSMLFSLVTVSFAAPAASTLESTKIVNVVGKLENSGSTVNVLLKDGKDVKYINEFDVEPNGEYRIKFRCGDIAGLTLQVKQGEEDVTKSVVSAVAENDAVVYDLDVVNSPINTEVVAEIENHYNVVGKEYQVIVAYYGDNNTLQNVIVNDKKVGEGLNIFAEDFKIPDDAKKIKVFMWDNAKTMIPLADSVEGKKSDTIRVLAIGNSFAVDAFAYLDEIAKNEGVELDLRIAQIGGASFSTHWKAWKATEESARFRYTENGKKCDITHFLEDGSRYDYITIQQSSANSGNLDKYMVDGENVVKYIRERQPTAEILIHQTWAYEKGSPVDAFAKTYNNDQEGMRLGINEAVTTARIELAKVKTDSGLEVSPGGKPLRYIPAGDAFYLARQNPLFDTTHDGRYVWDEASQYNAPVAIDESVLTSLCRDSYHCSLRHGRYLVGLVWYRCLTGNSVLNNDYTNSSHPISEEGRPIINAAAQKAVDDTGLWDNY